MDRERVQSGANMDSTKQSEDRGRHEANGRSLEIFQMNLGDAHSIIPNHNNTI